MSFLGTREDAKRYIKEVECPTVTPSAPNETSPVLKGGSDGGGLKGKGMDGVLTPRNFTIKQSKASKNIRRTYGLDSGTMNRK
jgi:hypothetical protein